MKVLHRVKKVTTQGYLSKKPQKTLFTKAIRNILLRRVLALLGSFLLSVGQSYW